MKEYIYSSDDEPIMTIEEQSEIVEWTKKNYKYFLRNNGNKYMQKIDYFDNLPKCILEIKKRIFDKEKLYEYEQEPIFRDSIGIMFKDTNLHLHTDPNPKDSNLIHTRFNVYVQLPKKGGYPIYGGVHCKLKERTYLCCRSGLDLHCCAKVEDDRERIVLSFGVLAPPERIEKIVYKY